jgi:1-acyl-sn-glycerol-3-phosphate acyltransferase
LSEDWQYDTLADLEKPLAASLKDFPREPHLWIYGLRGAAALGLRGWLRLVHQFEVIGRENVPVGQSMILVANHQSHWDALCLLSALPLGWVHRAFPAAAADYFFTSLPRSLVAAVVVNALPFDRHAKGAGSIALCRRLLAVPGHALVLFPEGTRSPDGRTAAFKPGIGLLVAGTEIPVVPCYIGGAWESWPRERVLPRPGRLRVVIGPPRRYSHLPKGKESVLAVAEDLQAAVTALRDGRVS